MKKMLLPVLLACTLLLSACGSQKERSTPEPMLPAFDISKVAFSNTQIMLSESHDSVGAPYGLKKHWRSANMRARPMPLIRWFPTRKGQNASR